MPGLDGFGVVRELRRDAQFAATPVMALTASAMQGDRERAFPPGFTGYISKPIRLRTLRSEVERLLLLGICMSATTNPALSLLIIDDNAKSLELLSTALAQPGLEILTASDPEEGLDLVYNQHPQIVLTDLVMPHLSGMEVLERIMEFDPSTEVILMTAHYSTESAVEAIKKGASDYLNKPISHRGAARARRQAGRRGAQAAARAAARRRAAGKLRVRRNRRPQPADVGDVFAHPPRGAALSHAC